MAKESCENCIYHVMNHWVDPQQHICTKTMEIFVGNPSSIPTCIAYKPKPEYILKENPSYTELRKELERLQEDGAKISRELEVWMNSVNTTIGLLRHKEAEIDKLRRIKNEITGKKESD